jgi:hypothetical protein
MTSHVTRATKVMPRPRAKPTAGGDESGDAAALPVTLMETCSIIKMGTKIGMR